MDLSVKYMGLDLKNPLIAGASTLTNNVKNIREMEENGIAAIVLRSLFEEQIINEINGSADVENNDYSYPAASELIKSITKNQKARPYLKFVEDVVKNVKVPVIASVNCVTNADWVNFAKQIQDAGAQALELNISTLMPQKNMADGNYVIKHVTDIVENVTQTIKIPVAVKINPTPAIQLLLANQIEKAGAKAMVLFNRAYQPDIDIEKLAIITNKYESSPAEILQAMRWIGIISPNTKLDISASTGIHDFTGVVKQILAGASTAQLCTTLYKNGIGVIGSILKDLEQWMEGKKYKSINDFKGKMAQNEKSTMEFERVQYLQKNFE